MDKDLSTSQQGAYVNAGGHVDNPFKTFVPDDKSTYTPQQDKLYRKRRHNYGRYGRYGYYGHQGYDYPAYGGYGYRSDYPYYDMPEAEEDGAPEDTNEGSFMLGGMSCQNLILWIVIGAILYYLFIMRK